MTPETYVIGSIVLSVIVIAILYSSADSTDSIDDAMKCPRCGAVMEVSGGGMSEETLIHVVPEILVVTCPQCGYSERSWPYQEERKPGHSTFRV